jgi:hypothetical protein
MGNFIIFLYETNKLLIDTDGKTKFFETRKQATLFMDQLDSYDAYKILEI